MTPINLVFGTNNGIAAGTPEAQIEKLYQTAFKPFLATLYEFPGVALTLHYSGVLLEWLEERHPEFIMLINEMARRGQIELLGGTYYQTVLPLIPSNDRTAQVELLTTLLRRRFGKRPRGAWVTELVWEPSMPSSLKRCGMDYVFLSDRHFVEAGLRNAELYRPVLTEDQGKTLFVFPVSEEMKLFPYTADPKRTARRVAALARAREERVVSLMAEGEYFGHWNDTYSRLYEDGWLAGFLEEISNLKETVHSAHPSEYLSPDKEYCRCYFPCTSYEEMMRWSLPAELGRELEKLISGRISQRNRAYLKGGYFRQFLSKYPETNLMYSKLIRTYDLVNQVRGDKYRKKAAREELWKGEDHSAYWHGRRGGVYVSPIRKAVYSALIAAEKTARERGIFRSHISVADFDLDGMNEYLCNGSELNLYIHRKGGMVFELDYLAEPWNYLDTFSRRAEHYQQRTERSHIIDKYPRRAFLDHFFAPGEKIAALEKLAYDELGNFLTLPYQVRDCRKDSLDLVFFADGMVATETGQHPVTIEKRYRMNKTTVTVDYSIANNGTTSLAARFSPEINLSFTGAEDEHLGLLVRRGKEAKAVASRRLNENAVDGFTAIDKKNDVIIDGSWNVECDLCVFPVEAEWLDQEGLHFEYQSTCFFPVWKLSLQPGEVWRVTIRLSFSKTN
ncbi:MAG: DUF1926 domain-containing protein [Spirochaetales bacterium]|nr:DUF1926 domain-containing protein [Spirochaetales bacterium]